MRKVIEIMNKEYIEVDPLWGIRRVQDIAENADTDCFLVTDNEKFIGVLTKKDLIKAHPNRIVLDAMYGSYKCIDAYESVWKAKELLDEGTDVLIINRGGKILGIVTKNEIGTEIGKHFDLLTNLYKRDYIIYKSIKLLEQGSKICFIFFDVNSFGQIDKKYGHVIGDKILRNIAQILKDNLPEGSFLCRYGGDEFVLLSDKCVADCEILARYMLASIKKHKFHGNINISASAGIAGGRKLNHREINMYKTVKNLINLASLASTKAKNEKVSLALGYDGAIDDIA